MQFSACGASSDDCCNGGCVDVFLTSVVSLLMVSIVFVLWGVCLIQGNGYGDSDIVNYLLRTTGGHAGGPSLLFL